MTEALTIGVVPGVTADKWVRVWRERMPRVALTVVPLSDDEVGGALPALADMVFARLPVRGLERDRVNVIELWAETPMVVAGKDHPVKVFDSVTLADLADEQLHAGWDPATLDIVAAGHGVARMPQSVFRALGRRDLVARAISDAEPTRVGLVWSVTTQGPAIDEFIGIVRGRTTNSSRGAEAAAGAPARPTAAQPPARGKPARSPGPVRQRRQGRGGRPTGRRRG